MLPKMIFHSPALHNRHRVFIRKIMPSPVHQKREAHKFKHEVGSWAACSLFYYVRGEFGAGSLYASRYGVPNRSRADRYLPAGSVVSTFDRTTWGQR